MNDIFLILGSNIDKETNLPRAVVLLRDMTDVVAVAGVYETSPVGLLEQPVFWNTAVHLQAPLSPAQIKTQILSVIERRLERVRQADKNAPRTIDLDIVLFNDLVGGYDPGDGHKRPIPDPDLLRFPHVAVPIAELAPHRLHPQTGETLEVLAARLTAATSAPGHPSIFRREDVLF